MLEDGDATEIGVKGVTLSGGRRPGRTRHSYGGFIRLLACVYSRKKYLILNDPSSAVDSDTARTIYQKCLLGPLLKDRTVILVTHHFKLVLPGAHYFIRMDDGRIDIQGTVADLCAQGILEDIARAAAVDGKRRKSLIAAAAFVGGQVAAEDVREPQKLVKEEHRGDYLSSHSIRSNKSETETGSVKLSVYKTYTAAGGYPIWILLTAVTLVRQLRNLGEKVGIKIWTDAYTSSSRSSLTAGESNLFGVQWPDATDHPMFYVGVYAALGLSQEAPRVSCSGDIQSIIYDHSNSSSSGRLMNRFSKDFETIDSGIAMILQVVNNAIGEFFVSLLAVACPQSISAFSAEKRFLDNLHAKIDETSKIGYAFWQIPGLFTDVIVIQAVFITALFAIRFLHNDAGLAGVVITYIHGGSLLNCVGTRFEVTVPQCLSKAYGINLMFSAVEPIIEYLELPQEPPAVVDSNRPPAYWPSNASNDALIVVEDLTVKYAPEVPPVLNGISIIPTESGRARGSGGKDWYIRTWLVSLKLKQYRERKVNPGDEPPAFCKIIIDGIDISRIGTYGFHDDWSCGPQLLGDGREVQAARVRIDDAEQLIK
ncbi:hypothetical protein DFH09DRAFT_1079729 [Mycena vulgaris]|nr:hypothetical protein DFH09DRAFT_1079729 [Mycena vulgaris]